MVGLAMPVRAQTTVSSGSKVINDAYGVGQFSVIVIETLTGSGPSSYQYRYNVKYSYSFQKVVATATTTAYPAMSHVGSTGINGFGTAGVGAWTLTHSTTAINQGATVTGRLPTSTNLNGTTGTLAAISRGSTMTFECKTNHASSNAVYLTINVGVGTAKGRNITLTYTNPSATESHMIGIQATSNPGVIAKDSIQTVEPGQTATAKVFIPAGSTETYSFALLNYAQAFADGSIQYDPPTGAYYFTEPGESETLGTPMGWADGFDGYAASPSDLVAPAPSVTTAAASATPSQFNNPNAIATTTPTAAVTQGSAVESTNAITKALGDLGTKLAGGVVGGGGGTDMSGVESRLDTANAHLTKLEEYAKNGDDFLQDAKKMDGHDEGTLTAKASTQGASAQGAFDGAMAAHTGNLPDGSGPTVPGGSGAWPTFTIPFLGTIEFSPYALAPWMIPYMNAAREVILWALVAGFILFSVEKVNEYALQVATVPQVSTTLAVQDMIPAAGQALSWLKGGISTAGIITTLVVAYGAGVGVINSNMGSMLGTTMKVFMGGSSATSAMGVGGTNAIWGFLMECFPMSAFLALIVADVVLLAAMGPLFLGAAVVVRSIRV